MKNLWDMVNANLFYKVNAFGLDIHFYFKRDETCNYYSPIGQIIHHADDIVLMVQVTGKSK